MQRPHSERGPTTSLMLFTPFLRLLEQAEPLLLERAIEGSERTLARWGISRAQLAADPRMRLPFGLSNELLVGFVDALGDPTAPLRAAMALREGDYELIEYLSLSSATLAESIKCIGRYYALLGPAELELHIDGSRAESRFRITTGLPVPDAVNEFAIASNFVMAQLHSPPGDLRPPIEICFTHLAPAHADIFPLFFHAPVRFGCEHNAIVFDAGMLDRPTRRADPVLHQILCRLADHELEALFDNDAFRRTVRAAIDSELLSGATLVAVADRLNISPSTLRSRLRLYGTTYSAMLDRVRRERAQRALRRGQQNISEVAHDLGFAHPAAFHRAVKRWFGMTPNAYRDAQTLHPAPSFWRDR